MAPAAQSGNQEEASQPEQLQKPSIAVLPFNNMSGDPEQEYFSDGITEDIITDLSNVSGLFVVARNTAFTYKGKAVKVQRGRAGAWRQVYFGRKRSKGRIARACHRPAHPWQGRRPRLGGPL